MKKITKRNLTISSVILGLGAIATSITLPLLLLSQAPSTINLDDVLFEVAGPDGEVIQVRGRDVIKRLEILNKEDKTKLSRLDYYLAFFLYEAEQKASLKLQEAWFKWEIFDLNNQIDKNKEDNLKDEVEKEKSAKNLEEKLKNVKEKLVKLQEGKIDFDSTSFKNEFEKVLLPLEKVKIEQIKKYHDEKENNITKAVSRKAGELAWELQRREKYNGAITDDEAIDFLTNKEIESKSFGQFEFKINSEFTYEQKWATDENDELIFGFLQNAKQADKWMPKPTPKELKEVVGEKDKASKVYFLSSNSNDLEKISLNFNDKTGVNAKIIQRISQQKLMKVQHALIKVKQNKNGAAFGWEFIENRDSLKKLLSFFGHNKEKVLDMLPDLFNPNKDKETNIIIDNFSDDASGKNKSGSLGVKTILEYLEEMVSGFGFGILAAKEGEELTDFRKGRNFLQELAQNLKQVSQEIWKDQKFNNLTELENAVDALNDKDVEKFGNAVKNTFDIEGEGLKLWYPAGDHAKIVMSEHGIHIVKITDYENIEDLQAEINKDLSNVANKQDDKKSQTDWGGLLSSYFKDSKNQSGLNTRRDFIINELLGQEEDNKKLNDFINEKESKRNQDKRITLEDMKSLIKTLKNGEKVQEVLKALGKKIEEFIEKEIEGGWRQNDNTLEINKIFDKVMENHLNLDKGEVK